MASSWIGIDAADGGRFEGYLSLPPSGTGPGLVVVQEIYGVNASIRQLCDMFAAQGFVTLAPDLFWRFEPHIELGFDEAGSKRAQEYHKAFDYDQGMKDVGDAVAALRRQPQCSGRVFVTGFCLGGTFAYLSSTRLPVDGAVAYYGTRIHHYLQEAGRIACPLLLHFGEADHTTPPDVIEQIRAALGRNPKVTIHTYPGAKHAFANAMRPSNYDAKSASLAHERTFAFLRPLYSGSVP